jgi:DNA-binding XRE family transcriptional regulator
MESEKWYFCITFECLKNIMKEKESEKVKSSCVAILNKLAEKRQEAGFIQFDIAELLGITESGYFKVENGKTRLEIQRLLTILYKLDISPKEFFEDFK